MRFDLVLHIEIQKEFEWFLKMSGKCGGLPQIEDIAQKPHHIYFPDCPSATHWELGTSQLGSSGFGSRQMAQMPTDFGAYLQSWVCNPTANSTASGTKRDRDRKKMGRRLWIPNVILQAANRKHIFCRRCDCHFTVKGHI